MGRRPGSPNTCRGCPPAAEVKVRLRCRRGPVLAGPGCHSRGHGGWGVGECVLHNLRFAHLPPWNVTVFGSGAFAGVMDLNEAVRAALTQSERCPMPKGHLNPKRCKCQRKEHRKRRASGERPQRSTPARTLTSDLHSPELGENKFLLLEQPWKLGQIQIGT